MKFNIGDKVVIKNELSAMELLEIMYRDYVDENGEETGCGGGEFALLLQGLPATIVRTVPTSTEHLFILSFEDIPGDRLRLIENCSTSVHILGQMGPFAEGDSWAGFLEFGGVTVPEAGLELA